jgi:hypothetical protein
MTDKIKMIMVCLTHGEECDGEGFVADVGNQAHLYCCEDGFKQSLKDFADFEDKQRKSYRNN